MKNVAIVLAAGTGKRMNSNTKKQYMLLDGKTVLHHSIMAMEKCAVITEIVVVVGADEYEEMSTALVNSSEYSKISTVVKGGKERYHSVMNGLDVISAKGGAETVFIHDGARPMITPDIIERLYDDVCVSGAAVAAVKSKDTVKIANTADFVVSTPNRELVWNIQTPQVFKYTIVKEAYDILKEEECGLPCQGIKITDDAMVVETFAKHKVKLVEASYENIKITTPEDMAFAEIIMKRRKEKLL